MFTILQCQLLFMKKFFVILLVILPLFAHAQKQGQGLIDSLLQKLPPAKEDTNKVALLYDLAYVYQNINPGEGLKYSQVALSLSEKLEWKKGIGLANNSLGVNYDAKADYTKSLECHFKALKINEEIGDKKETARSLENIAFTYLSQSEHVKSLEYNFKALAIFEEVNDKEGKAATLGAIGSVYQSENDYPKALDYQLKALNIHKELGNKNGMAANMGNIGLVYEHQNNYPQALVYNVMALQMYQDLGDKNGEQRNLGNMGNIYANLKNYPKALEYDFKALKIAQELSDKEIIAANFGNIGEIYLLIVKDTASMPNNDISVYKAANLEKAIDYLNKGVDISTEIGLLDAIIEFRQYLSEAYALAGKSKEALDNYKLFTALKDSLYSDANKMKIARMGSQFEAELKNRDIQIAQLKADKQRNQLLFFIAGGCLILIVIGGLLKRKETRNSIAFLRKRK